MSALIRNATALLAPAERRQFLYETGRSLFARKT
jgi:hypothetical protein